MIIFVILVISVWIGWDASRKESFWGEGFLVGFGLLIFLSMIYYLIKEYIFKGML